MRLKEGDEAECEGDLGDSGDGDDNEDEDVANAVFRVRSAPELTPKINRARVSQTRLCRSATSLAGV